MYCFDFLLYIFIYFNDSCQTNYLKMYRTDLRQIYRVGRNMAADDQSEISFFDPSRAFFDNLFQNYLQATGSQNHHKMHSKHSAAVTVESMLLHVEPLHIYAFLRRLFLAIMLKMTSSVNRKYTAYRDAARGGPSHGQRQHAQMTK